MMLKPHQTNDKDPGDKINAKKTIHKIPIALINATVAVSLGTLLLAWSGSELAGGLGLIFPTADLYPLERVATIPFTFSFVYGLWMAHCNGGKIWIAVMSFLSLFSLLFYEWYRAHIDLNHLDSDLFIAGISVSLGASAGFKSFKVLRRRCPVSTALVHSQAFLLAFPLILFILNAGKLPHNLPTYVIIGLTLGAGSGIIGGGRSIIVALIMAGIAAALPSIAGLSVMCLYTKHGFWSHVGCITLVTTAISYNITFTAIGMLAAHMVKRAWHPPDGTAPSPTAKGLLASVKERLLPQLDETTEGDKRAYFL